DVVLVEAEPRRALEVERLDRLAGRETAERRQSDLDHEATALLEVCGGVLEARDLRLLGRQVHDRVEDEVDERERPVDARRPELADRHRDLRAAGLRAK